MTLIEFVFELKVDINKTTTKNYCFRALQKYLNPLHIHIYVYFLIYIFGFHYKHFISNCKDYNFVKFTSQIFNSTDEFL